MRCVAVDAEHPRGWIGQRWHVAAGDGLMVLDRVNLSCNAWTVPRTAFVIRPFYGHAEQGVHVELHDAVSPWIDVHVRVVAVGYWQ